MRRLMLMTSLVVALAACGQGGARREGVDAGSGSCALIQDANAIFGADAQVVSARGIEGMDATCTFSSADGARGGDLVTYTAASLGSTTIEAKMAETAEKWDAMTETPLAPVDGLGEGAQIATNLPGYQTQIMFRKGDTLVLVMASSGDNGATGEQLARRMAEAANAAIPAAP
jgi:hypothetical protein